MSQKIYPAGSRLLIERETAPETTKGGIVLPDTAKEKPCRGKILEIGPGRVLESGARECPREDYAVGRTVIIPRYEGTEVKVDGKDCLIVDAAAVLGIIVDE
jgi:chaperonin GroES